MKIAIGSDHRGYDAKRRIIPLIEQLGHEVLDMGPSSSESVDYPDYALQVAQAVGEKRVDRGVLICGTGIGMCITANKVKGVRAAPCHDSITAEMSRRHNDANILCLSADLNDSRTVADGEDSPGAWFSAHGLVPLGGRVAVVQE